MRRSYDRVSAPCHDRPPGTPQSQCYNLATVTKIISGGQTGADQAGLAAAKRLGIPTGGFFSKGFLTEAGPRPDLAAEYRLEETTRPPILSGPSAMCAWPIEGAHNALHLLTSAAASPPLSLRAAPGYPGRKYSNALEYRKLKSFSLCRACRPCPARCAILLRGQNASRKLATPTHLCRPYSCCWWGSPRRCIIASPRSSSRLARRGSRATRRVPRPPTRSSTCAVRPER